MCKNCDLREKCEEMDQEVKIRTMQFQVELRAERYGEADKCEARILELTRGMLDLMREAHHWVKTQEQQDKHDQDKPSTH